MSYDVASRRQLPKPIQKPEYSPEALGAACGSCSYRALGATPCKPRTNSNSRSLVVLDQPDPQSVKHGELRTTASQKLLEKSLAANGAGDGVSYLYTTACRRPEGATDKDEQQAIQACSQRLANEFEQASPPRGATELFWVLALGKNSFQAATGKGGDNLSWVGSPIEGVWPNTKVICSFDPWFISTQAGRRYGFVFQRHIERYVQLQDGRLKEWVWPEMVLDNTADALRRVLKVAQAGGEYGFDIEATGLDFEKDTITCLGFATEDLGVSVKMPCTMEEDFLCRSILACGTMVGVYLTGYDRRMMVAKKYKLTPHYEDLLLAHLVLEPAHKVRKLGWQAGTETWAPAWKSEHRQDDTGNTHWERGTEEQEREHRLYNARDTWMSLYLWRLYKQRLDEYK